MLKALKLVFAVVLLPVCYGAGFSVWKILCNSGKADATWVPLVAGAVCWGVVYLLLPRPMWLYVAGHELTHAVWAWLFGGKVKRVKISASGGHIILSRTNFLIALAPYFFPFYAACVVLGFLLARLAWSWSTLAVWFHLTLGAAYAFHVTLTGHVLKTQQSDIIEHGYIFSSVIIFLGNMILLMFGLPLLTDKVSLLNALHWWWDGTAVVFAAIRQCFQ